MTDITPTALADFIAAYRRVHGQPPKLRDCVEHFDGRLLNVLMCLWEAVDRGMVRRGDLRRVEKWRPAR